MPITLKEQSDFTPVPEGTHLARCYRIVDCGVQPDTGFGERHKLIITWELPKERIKAQDGTDKPMSISRIYTASLNGKANLRQDLARWRTRDFTKEELKGFVLNAILGKPCQVAVVINDKGKSAVDGVFAAPKGVECPPQENTSMEYSLEMGKDCAVYKALPDWIRTMVDAGLANLAAAAQQKASEDDHVPEAPEGDSEIPF